MAFVAIGDSNGLICLGVKCSKEVATAIRGAIILAKLSVMPVRRGYWGNNIGKPHTVLCKKLLQMAGIEDCVGVAKLEIRVTSYTNLSGGSSAMLR
ncbi:hypothetical protein quinque_013601 [Culex quinquefasciatus]